MIIGILATDIKGNIGNNNDLLIKISEDLQRFKFLTEGKSVLMGKRTFESIGKKLPKRTNYILTNSVEKFYEKYGIDEKLIAINKINCNSTLDKNNLNLDKFKGPENEDIYIIGGASIYNSLLPICDKIELTLINNDFGICDTKVEFTESFLSGNSGFEIKDLSELKIDKKTGISYSFLTLIKSE